VLVDRAPALFFVPCGDSRCTGGGHDLTHAIMHALHAGETRSEGEDRCHGTVGSGECGRTIGYAALATYTSAGSGTR
jgi:hypothetical protein